MTQISTKKTVKSNISLRQLVDVDESGGSKDRYDNIFNGQVLTAFVNINRPKTFQFKFLSAIVKAGTGITVTSNPDGSITIAATAGGDMYKSVYDIDNDGVVDQAECVKIVVRNSTGATLTKGQVVYLSGATGNRPNAVLSDASTEATSSKTIGLVSANIANNSDGYVTISGTMHDLDLSMFAAGDRLWLNNSPGGMVANIPPAEPNHAVFIGTVARAHPTQGRIVLAVQNGYELDELHGVSVPTPSNNDVVVYESATSLWKNKSLATILGYTPFNLPALTSGSVLFSDGTTVAQNNANFFWDNVNNRLGIGTNAPSVRLDVVGDAIITGATALSNQNALLVRNTSAVHGLSVTNNAEVKIGRNQLFGFFDTSTGGYTFNITATNSGVSISNNAAASRPVSFSMNTGEILRIHQSYTAIVTNNFLVGTTTDVASAILQASSTTKGFLPPRMTTTQKNAIATPAAGLVVYDTNINRLNVYNGTTWIGTESTTYVFNMNSFAVPNGSLFYGVYLGGTPVTPPTVATQYGGAATDFFPGYPMPAGTASTLVVILRAAQVAPTSIVTLKLANTNTSTFGPVVTIAAGSAAGTYTDNSATVSFAANERLNIIASNPFVSGATASGTLTTGSFKYTT